MRLENQLGVTETDVYLLKFWQTDEDKGRVRFLAVVRNGLFHLPNRDEVEALCKVTSPIDFDVLKLRHSPSITTIGKGTQTFHIYEGLAPNLTEARLAAKPFIKSKSGKVRYCIRTIVPIDQVDKAKEILFDKVGLEIVSVVTRYHLAV